MYKTTMYFPNPDEKALYRQYRNRLTVEHSDYITAFQFASGLANEIANKITDQYYFGFCHINQGLGSIELAPLGREIQVLSTCRHEVMPDGLYVTITIEKMCDGTPECDCWACGAEAENRYLAQYELP